MVEKMAEAVEVEETEVCTAVVWVMEVYTVGTKVVEDVV